MNLRSNLETEIENPKTTFIDKKTIYEILTIINTEDQTIANHVKQAIPQIEETVKICVSTIKNDCRIYYLGAGTSGRLGVLDASEIPPTFSVNNKLFTGVIAGGDKALRNSIEGAEDIEENGIIDLKDKGISKGDFVIGISTSGAALYVKSALDYAKSIGAKTCYLICNSEPFYKVNADIIIRLKTGSEVIAGSTRMKAGTATKMVLNMISTTTMIKLGKVYKNLMVDLMSVNKKLEERGIRIIVSLTGIDKNHANFMLKKAENSVKKAIIMIDKNCTLEIAELLLNNNDGYLGKIFKEN